MYNVFNRIKNIHIFSRKLPSKVTFKQDCSCKRLNEIAVEAKNAIVYARTDGTMLNNQTLVFSRTGKPLGKHSFCYNTGERSLVGGYMHTFPQNKGKGIGEIMRLMSIINMKENNMEKIDIKHALPKAIPFHVKYKFIPNIKDKDKAIEILNGINKNDCVENEFKKTAIELVKLLDDSKTEKTTEHLLHTVNRFIGVYINKHSDNWEKTMVDDSIPMILTSKRINKNAKFFNALFDKHKINYRV